MNKYLKETQLLDYSHPEFENLFKTKEWSKLKLEKKIKAIYNYVRDDIAFGYNEKDEIPGSRVLKEGYGQCNTKGILLMTLLRKAAIPCRMHGFTIDKKLQKGAITGIWYKLSPKSIIHSWVEVNYKDNWYNLEGFIIDRNYLEKIQKKYLGNTTFCGFGIATKDLMNPQIDWELNDTYIQKEGINADFGTFDTPDEFLNNHKQKLGIFKNMIYKNIVRISMNRNVNRMRTT